MTKPLVTIEHPFAGDFSANIAYAKRCLLDSLRRGEAPFASALLYGQDGVLDDTNPEERKLGMEAGFAWGMAADYVVAYVDRGLSPGMEAGLVRAMERYVPIEFRSIEGVDVAPYYERYAHAPALRMPGEAA